MYNVIVADRPKQHYYTAIRALPKTLGDRTVRYFLFLLTYLTNTHISKQVMVEVMDEEDDVTAAGRVTTLGPLSFNLYTCARLRSGESRPPGPRPAVPSGPQGGRPRKAPTKAQSERLNKVRSMELTHHHQKERRKAKRERQAEVEDGVEVVEAEGSQFGGSSPQVAGSSQPTTRSASKKQRVDARQ